MVPVPGPMVEQGSRADMVEQGAQAAMAAMVGSGDSGGHGVGSPPPQKKLLGRSLPGGALEVRMLRGSLEGAVKELSLAGAREALTLRGAWEALSWT